MNADLNVLCHLRGALFRSGFQSGELHRLIFLDNFFQFTVIDLARTETGDFVEQLDSPRRYQVAEPPRTDRIPDLLQRQFRFVCHGNQFFTLCFISFGNDRDREFQAVLGKSG